MADLSPASEPAASEPVPELAGSGPPAVPRPRAAVADELSFDLHVREQVTGEHSRWVRGLRVEMEPEAAAAAASVAHPVLGTVRATGPLAGLPEPPLSAHGVVCAEVDLQPRGRGGVPEPDPKLRRAQAELVQTVAAWGWGEPVGRDLAEAALRPPTRLIPSQSPVVPDGPAAGWAAADLWLLTSVAPSRQPDHTPWCLRGARLLYSDAGLLIAWHPFTGAHRWRTDAHPRYPLPLPERNRRHGQLAIISGDGGAADAGRLVQDTLQHHEWTEWQLTQTVEAWERDFFAVARDGAFEAGLDVRQLGARLDEAHRLLGQLRHTLRDIDRRARLRWLPDPEMTPVEPAVGSLPDEVRVRAERVSARIDLLNQSLRDGWTLLSSAASGARLQLEKQGLERERRFHFAAAFVATLVLVPGLVIGLYSANVAGLPGMGRGAGLRNIGIYAVLAALITGGSLRAMSGGRRVLGYLTLTAGLAVLVLATILLLSYG